MTEYHVTFEGKMNVTPVDEGPPPPPANCPEGSTCFERLGTFFVPTEEKPTHEVVMPVPPGTYTKIRLRMEVLHGGWQDPASGLHNIFWFVLGGNRDMIGYVNLLGPQRNQILLRHGVGLPQTEKPKVLEPFRAAPGETYEFDYLYDMATGVVDLAVVNKEGEVVKALSDVPNVAEVVVRSGQRFRIGLSFEGHRPNEPATIGWEYRDLRVEFTP